MATHRITASRQIILGFSALFGLCAVIGLIGERASNKINEHLDQAIEVLLPATDLLIQNDSMF